GSRSRTRRGRAAARLPHRHRRPGIFKISIEHLQRFEHRRAGDLDVDIELRSAMLQRLEFADRLAELLALLEIADRAAEHLLTDADHFGGHRATADIEYALQQLVTLVDLAEYAVGVALDIVEPDPRRVVGIDHHGAFGLDAFCLGIHQEKR